MSEPTIKASIENLGPLKGKRVLIRVDFNVPIENGEVQDDFRLRSALSSLVKITSQGGRAIVLSHLGRPKGKVTPGLSLAPVAKALQTLISAPVHFCEHAIGPDAESAVANLADGEILVLENVRFYQGEKKNDPEFTSALAKLGDVFVSDAFGTCHRAHASVVGLPALLPSAAGDLVINEIENLSPLLNEPPRPFVVVLGGAKLETKIPLMRNLLPKVDAILVGGGMAYTLLSAQGRGVGKSRVDESLLEISQSILEDMRNRSRSGGSTLVLPVDHVTATSLETPENYDIADQDVPDHHFGLDIGPKTLAQFISVLSNAKTVFWNGPLGFFEKSPYHLGTHYLATYLANRKSTTRTIVGGGDSAAAVRQLGIAEQMAHVSTGGGASMEFLEGKSLPGIEALPDASE